MKLNFNPIKAKSWQLVLGHCRHFDVEEGEAPEYMYSVRSSTGTLTIWTRQGWADGWYQARVIGVPRGKTLVDLEYEPGSPPLPQAWSVDKLEMHIRELLARVVPEEKP